MAIYGLGDTHRGKHGGTNVGELERIVSGVAGGLLAVSGLSLLMRGHILTGGVFGAAGTMMAYRSATGHCPAYEHLGVTDAADELDARAPWTRALELHASVAVHRPASELYTYWRQLESLPEIMKYLERVEVVDEQRSRWTARGPKNKPMSWEAVITSDVPNEHIAWTSTEESQAATSGSVQFVPIRDGNDTLVRIAMQYHPPAGALGALAAQIFGRFPSKLLDNDLKNFKATMEAGETIVTAGQPRGACT